jgi:hypothetical protein
MAYIFGAAAVIALSVYVVLVCSEVFLQPRSKTQRAKAPQWACRVPVTEETLGLSGSETPILVTPERLDNEAAGVNTAPRGSRIPTAVPIVCAAGEDGMAEAYRVRGEHMVRDRVPNSFARRKIGDTDVITMRDTLSSQ